jgi:hypothetical protein
MRWTRVLGPLLLGLVSVVPWVGTGCVVEPEPVEQADVDGPVGEVEQALYGIGHTCTYNSDCTSTHCCGAPDGYKYCTTNCCGGSCWPNFCSYDCDYEEPYNWYYRGCCGSGYSWCTYQQRCIATSICSATCYLGE